MLGLGEPGPTRATLVLTRSIGRWLGVLATCVLFVVTSGALLWAGEAPFWSILGLGFFGAGSIVAAVQLLPRAGELRLDQDGFTIRSLFRTQALCWRDVTAPFRVVKIRSQKMVGFDLAGADGTRYLAELSKSVAGVHAGLPDTYGLRAEDLAALMNEWRDRALNRQS